MQNFRPVKCSVLHSFLATLIFRLQLSYRMNCDFISCLEACGVLQKFTKLALLEVLTSVQKWKILSALELTYLKNVIFKCKLFFQKKITPKFLLMSFIKTKNIHFICDANINFIINIKLSLTSPKYLFASEPLAIFSPYFYTLTYVESKENIFPWCFRINFNCSHLIRFPF